MVQGRFTLYYSDNAQVSNFDFDCIFGYLHDDLKQTAEPMIHNYYLIPYCRRPDTDEIQEKIVGLNKNSNQIISFDELKKQGVTSTQLLTWMAPIDVAERYEKYTGNLYDFFYNCSPPWFGSMCEYMFDYDTTAFLFRDIVNATFASRSEQCLNMEINPCYPFLLNCYRGPSPICLDWREICDRKFDCINGEDEEFCEQLELNECGSEEYRCHYGGQCIPLMFLDDGRTNVDCLDGSDEIDTGITYNDIMMKFDCNSIPTFLCEERICRYGQSISCGDGQCDHLHIDYLSFGGCYSARHEGITRILLTSDDNVSNIACLQVLRCLIRISYNVSRPCLWSISNDLNVNYCDSLITHCSSEWVAIPKQPNLYGFFQFIYLTNRSNSEFENNVLPNFVCFNPQRCPALLQMIVPIELNNGLTCCHISNIINEINVQNFDRMELHFKNIIRQCLTVGTELSCSHSSLFHCSRSLKCISHHRLFDGFEDCYFGEDESYPTCELNDSHRYKCLSNSNRCLSFVAVGNMRTDCPKLDDELISYERARLQRPPFPYFCNNLNETLSYVIDFKDEKHCEQWPCDNSYVRCNGRWNCYKGSDELNCPNTDCLPNQHDCYIRGESTIICLPIEYLFEKYLNNCEPRTVNHRRQIFFNNRTNNSMSEYMSWNKTNCITNDILCDRHSLISHSEGTTCLYQYVQGNRLVNTIHVLSINSEIDCTPSFLRYQGRQSPFSSSLNLGFSPPVSAVDCSGHISTVNRTIPVVNVSRSWYCNRGILVQFRSNKTSLTSITMPKCLCPPSYFGTRCQWQNQRVSLTLRLSFRSSTLANIVFQVIIMLIDEYNGQILPNHEQITFVPIRDCSTKFNIYLLYPERPKRRSANYSIRIDIFYKITLDYYGSWHLSIPFQFLPVNRLATQLFISELHQTESCPLLCGNHGKCRQYENKKSLYFCQCDQGYSGTFCNITEICHCSNNSVCLSSSICVCSLYHFGPQCYLKHETCLLSNNPCKNNGICIPNDDRISRHTFKCLCPEDYSGVTCEISNNRIDIQFDETTVKTLSSVLAHFITMFADREHERTTTLKKIPFDQNTITLFIQQPFNVLVIEFIQLTNKTYYLTVVREIFNRSENITTQLKSNQRCHSIQELLNSTFLNYEEYHRIKYYPMLCRQYKQLMCFYDDIYICICDLDRFSNCFEFNHNVTYNCQNQNICENDGECFDNNATCPTKSICVCKDCYYGDKCQFSTEGFFLSLDPILGYHIKPNVSITRQPLIVKLSIMIITCLFVFGLVSESLSIMTFRMKETRVVGCGWYLLASSSVSLCLLIMLKIKFWTLILSQKGVLTNRSFLSFSCIMTDGSLKILLATNDWLNACVAIERVFAVLHGVKFNKNKSKKLAKRLIFIILLLTICTYIHDPLYRKVIDDFDTDEKRTWCFIRFSSSLHKYNVVISLFHFLTPILINFISAVIIIVFSARRRSNAQTNVLFSQHLKQQLEQHKHLLWAPCVIVLLSLPGSIIPFLSGCMKSPRDPWLYLISYFISFIPVILHFFIFVRPSQKFMDEFKGAIEQTVRRFNRIFMAR